MVGIVVGVDTSAAGRDALRWALREAVARTLPVTAVRAWTIPAMEISYPLGMAVDGLGQHAHTAAEQLLAEEVKLATEEVPGADAVEVRTAALMGASAQVVLDAAQDAELVVVGSRGAGPLSRAVLGSVSSSVLHHATCPVVVVPEGGGRSGAPARVVVGVDHSPESYAALQVAVEQTRRSGAVLVPVLVQDPVQMGEVLTTWVDDQQERHANAVDDLRRAAADAGADGLRVVPEVATGQAGAALRSHTGPDDLLVVGSRGRGGFTGLLLGSTSTQVAQHAVCPVMVVRRYPESPSTSSATSADRDSITW